MNKLIRILFFIVVLVELCSCDWNEPAIPTQWTSIKLVLGVPIDDANSTRRSNMPQSFGDPGAYEQFHYPRHLYLFFVAESKVGSGTVVQGLYKSLDESAWSNGVYNGSKLQADGDSIFTYRDKIDVKLPVERENYTIEVYAVMSYVPINELVSAVDEGSLPTTKDAVLNLKFNLTDEVKQNLQHVYSSPYNYNIDGHYYGTMPNGIVASLNMLLYHVASKVDLIWNVPDNQQTQYSIKQITINNLYDKPGYIFKPMQNADEPTNDSYNLLIKRENDVAMQYKGRYYFYTLPYSKDGFMDIVADVNFETADHPEGEQRKLTFRKTIDNTGVFVPWIRGNMNFTTMPTRDQVKTVD